MIVQSDIIRAKMGCTKATIFHFFRKNFANGNPNLSQFFEDPRINLIPLRYHMMVKLCKAAGQNFIKVSSIDLQN